MKFHIAPLTVTVEITDREPINEHGKPCDAGYDYDNDRIYIYRGMRGVKRERALWHELSHIYCYVHQLPQTEEAFCHAASWVQSVCGPQYARQGGRPALDQMKAPCETDMELQASFEESMRLAAVPAAAIDADESFVPAELFDSPAYGYAHHRDDVHVPDATHVLRCKASDERAMCQRCGRVVAGGSVVRTRKVRINALGEYRQNVTHYCPHCGHLQRLVEVFGANGEWKGITLRRRFISGPRVAAWLRRHPEAAELVG